MPASWCEAGVVARRCARMVLLMTLAAHATQIQAGRMIDAGEFTLSDYAGKLVYVDFWASWCTPCRASFPFMSKLSDQHPESLAVVAINVDTSSEDAMAFLEEFRSSFDIVFDPDGVLAREFNVPGMPTSYLFDQTGQPIGRHVGFRKSDEEAIRTWIEDQLN